MSMHKNVWLNLFSLFSFFILFNLFTLGCLVFTSPAARANEPISKSFDTALKLTRAYAIYDGVRYYPASYQFTLQIPPTVKQSLARLTIDIPDDNAAFGMELPKPKNILVFNPTESESLLPHYSARTILTRITLEKRTVVLDFEPPLSANQTITIEFTKMQNPDQAGTYLLGVQALPSGKDTLKQFVGYGRLVFRDLAAD
jgi:Protein of unknown function (DUF2808)